MLQVACPFLQSRLKLELMIETHNLFITRLKGILLLQIDSIWWGSREPKTLLLFPCVRPLARNSTPHLRSIHAREQEGNEEGNTTLTMHVARAMPPGAPTRSGDL